MKLLTIRDILGDDDDDTPREPRVALPPEAPQIWFHSHMPESAFLSNAHPCRMTIKTSVGLLEFRCLEAAYQAAKLPEKTLETLAPFQTMYGKQAQRASRDLPPHPRDGSAVVLMKKLLAIKFSDPKLRKKLLATGTDELVHYSPWDRYWGVDADKNGFNKLGKLLMDLRASLRSS